MLDINQYTYSQTPFEKQSNFSIHPFDDFGRKTYFYDKESHARMYLDKLNSRFLRKIYEEKNGEPKNNEEVKCEDVVFDSNKLQEESKSNLKQRVNTSVDIENRKSKIDDYQVKCNKTLKKSISERNYKSLDKKLEFFGSSNLGRSKKRNHLWELSNKDSFYTFKPKRKKIGFESYNIPRIYDIIHDEKNIKFNDFQKRILNSFSNGFNNESKRLKELFLCQTSNEALIRSHLPKISYVTNKPELVIRTTGIGNSKYLGLKYNPYNFLSGNHKNMTKRNNYGALFQH